MKTRGFTIVEIIVTLTVIAILLVLGVVNLSQSQLNGRNDKRVSDVNSIGLILESYYSSTHTSETSSFTKTYPGTSQLVAATSISGNFLRQRLPEASLQAPGVETGSSLVAATVANENPGSVTPEPSITTYTYQAIAFDGSLCNNETTNANCVRFNIYYRLEGNRSCPEAPEEPPQICMYRSKHR